MVDIIAVTVTQDYIDKPYTRTVSIVTSGSGSYNVKEGNTIIQTVINSTGFDIFDVNNISLGTHTYCAVSTTSSACDTFTVSSPLPDTVNITSIMVSQDYLNQPYTRTVTILGIGSGNYQIKEGTNVIANRNLVNGFDIFDLTNISIGTHIYCAVPSTVSICDTFTVNQQCVPNWLCELPYNGYENDGCGNRRLNNNCKSQSTITCGADEINVSNKCYKRNDVYMLVGAIGLIMLLK